MRSSRCSTSACGPQLKAGQHVIACSPIETALEGDAGAACRVPPGDLATLATILLDPTDRTDLAGVDEMSVSAARALLAEAGSDVVVVLGRPSLAESGDSVVAAASIFAAEYPERQVPLRAPARERPRRARHGPCARAPARPDIPRGAAELVRAAWGPIPTAVGRDTREMLSAAAVGEIDVLVLLGADPLADFPDRALARRRARSVPVRRLTLHSRRRVNPATPMSSCRSRRTGSAQARRRTSKVGSPHSRRRWSRRASPWAPWVVASEFAARLGGDLGADSLESFDEEIDPLAPAYAGIVAAFSDPSVRRDGVVVPITGAAPSSARV